jgi:hypothetical protein
LLDIVQLSYKDKRQEEESLDLLDMLIIQELAKQLPLPILPLVDKLKALTPLTDAGKYFINSRIFLLTSNNKQAAFTSITSSFLRIQEYLVLSESVDIELPYSDNYQALKAMIHDNLVDISAKLSLNDEQVSDLQLIL